MESTTEFIYEVNMNMKEFLKSDDSSSGIDHELLDDNSLTGNNQITFEIPSNLDLERIKSLDNFTNLLHRIGGQLTGATSSDILASTNLQNDIGAKIISNDGHNINNEQIGGSVVLNLADIKNSGGGDNLASFFGNTDIHLLINYLWIGVVTSLIILSVIFIIFSCYFYRKFKEWKKCNKDIRSQMSNDLYPNGGVACGLSEDNYYQMESPPCYTIATGLPSYDEALKHTTAAATHYTFEPKFITAMDASTSTSSAFLSDGINIVLCKEYLKPTWSTTATNETYFASALSTPSSTFSPTSASSLAVDFNKEIENFNSHSVCITVDKPEMEIEQQGHRGMVMLQGQIYDLQNSNGDGDNNCNEIVVIS